MKHIICRCGLLPALVLLLGPLPAFAQQTGADSARQPSGVSAGPTLRRLKTNDAVLPRWAFDLHYRYSWLSQDLTTFEPTNAYGPNSQPGARFPAPVFSGGQGIGGDLQLSYFFGRQRRFGIGIGGQFMHYTGTATIDSGFRADYQSTDGEGRTFRQIIRGNTAFNEDVKINNINIPVLLRFKHQFGRAQQPSPLGVWLDAGPMIGISNETRSTASGNFSYEAIYKLSPDKVSVVSGFDNTANPFDKQPSVATATSLLLTENAYNYQNNSDGRAPAYFDNLHSQGFNIGLNKSIAPSQREQKTSYDAISFGAIVQGGISYQLNYNVTFMLGGYYIYQSWRNSSDNNVRITDKIINEGGQSYANYHPLTDAVKQSNYSAYGLSAGFRIFFGEKKDVDGDGVRDKLDKCPFVAGIERFGGCPDTDGDGITDAEDACPTEAGPEATGGCPDRDADGIPDIKDKCPDTYGEMRNGCPFSEAIKTARTDSTLSLDNGNVLPPHIVLETDVLYFSFGKAELSDAVRAEVDNAIHVLQKEPKVVLYISGHTDDLGSDERNLYLSYQRANAVRNYLDHHGIDRNRIYIGGYGKEKPIAPNDNEKDRAKNRRVELKLLLPVN